MSSRATLDDDSSPLCCCEFYNRHGDRTHILQCLCNCDELDEAVDTLVRGRRVGRDRLDELFSEVDDRMRLPLPGGAWHIGLPGAAPWVVLPAHFLVASIGTRCLCLSAAVMLPSLLWWHRRTLRVRRRSRFLLSWLVASVSLELLVFYLFGLPAQQPFESSLLLGSLITASLGCLARVREATSSARVADAAGAEARGARCAVCGHVVPRYDHYCAWTDTPIGSANHRAYLGFVASLLAGCALGSYQFAAASTARRGTSVWATLCAGRSGLLVASALYAGMVAALLSALLAHQLVLIARGLTTYESRKRLPPRPGQFLSQTAPLLPGATELLAALRAKQTKMWSD